MALSDWSPASWRSKVALQQPLYTDEAHLQQAVEKVGPCPGGML